ncbi:Hsp20/alpha crystallin family protein [Kineococcus indalonis]|uniref:Hsp20/alpha crystallin family protein n=1 Tax=Kineococcus indalonis TaxID=2696566 RepID=UPI00141377CB|nr:Hsp20/alpha crystallin family protein [Kineococcus indalonis]NAZ85143.1 Hsp20 family protein [Kineococcus indalonis]
MNTLSVWNRRTPFEAAFDAQFDALVRRTFGPLAPVGAARTPGFVPAAEVVRDGDDALVRLELPGVALEDVTVEVDGDRLVVRGERKDARTDAQRGRSEVRYGTFRRSFTLPATVTADAVSAAYEAGVLTVRVAGAHATARPTRIAVAAAAPAAVETGEQPAEQPGEQQGEQPGEQQGE